MTQETNIKMSKWQEDSTADVDARRVLIQHIVQLLEKCKQNGIANRKDKLVSLARRLEVALYKKSTSKEEYLDMTTLRQRVREVAESNSNAQARQRMHQQRYGNANGNVPPANNQGATVPSANPVQSGDLKSTAGAQQNGTDAKLEHRPQPTQQQNQTGAQTQDPQAQEKQRAQVLKQRQQRLLLLRHASKCTAKEGECKVTSYCAPMKKLWVHINQCKNPQCTVRHCVSSRYVLSHYHRCKDERCPVCSPVRMISQSQSQYRNKRSHESMAGANTNGVTSGTRAATATEEAKRLRMQQMSSQQKAQLQRRQQLLQQRRAQELQRLQNQKAQAQRNGTRSQTAGRNPGMPSQGYPRNPNVKMTPEQMRMLQMQKARAKHVQVIDPRYARSCKSGTGPSLPLSMDRATIERHLRFLKVERLQTSFTPFVRKLMEHKYNRGVFNEPVDPVKLNIPDYPNVIKKPMDLGTIRRRLDQGYYQDVSAIQGDLRLVFDNAIQFNPPGHAVHDMATQLAKLCEQELPKIITKMERDNKNKKDKKCQLCFQTECEICPLCQRGCIPFEPKMLYCAGPCGGRIPRNGHYYTGVGLNYSWCADCFEKNKDDFVIMNNQKVNKKDLIKKKNNDLFAEPWVNCDRCERWCHQVCALFNSRKNDPNTPRTYICPICLVNDAKLNEMEGQAGQKSAKKAVKSSTASSMSTRARDSSNVSSRITVPAEKQPPAAGDLPQTRLGLFLERWVREKMAAAQREQAKAKREFSSTALVPPSPGGSVPTAKDLFIRVVDNHDEMCRVKPYVRYVQNYTDFPYRSRCIQLFQRLEGVDVLIFALYVQEYGSDCPPPNKRKIYIAYLDSVHYFRPRRLRTLVYHELLIAYLEYSRRRGYTSAYIWACPPPNKRDDYILHCHPEDQRVPSAERLRKWYHDMIRRGAERRLFVGSCSLFEEHFEGSNRQNKKNKKKGRNNKKNKSKKGKSKKGKGKAKGSKNGNGLQNKATAAGGGDNDDEDEEAINNMLEDLPVMEGEGAAAVAKAAGERPGTESPVNSVAAGGSAMDAGAVTFLTPENGLKSGDDRMLPTDLARRRLNKLAFNSQIPYFEGDYWPQEAEELAKDIEKKSKSGDAEFGRHGRKRRRNGDEISQNGLRGQSQAAIAKAKEEQRANEIRRFVPRESLIGGRLAEQLDAMKDDFLVVKMAHECTRCGKYLLRGRWECRHPDCTVCAFNQSPPFALCNSCYILECKRPVEHQHGGGCILAGAHGKPKDESKEKEMEDGKDQTRRLIEGSFNGKVIEWGMKQKKALEARANAKNPSVHTVKTEPNAVKPATSIVAPKIEPGTAPQENVTTPSPKEERTEPTADVKTEGDKAKVQSSASSFVKQEVPTTNSKVSASKPADNNKQTDSKSKAMDVDTGKKENAEGITSSQAPKMGANATPANSTQPPPNPAQKDTTQSNTAPTKTEDKSTNAPSAANAKTNAKPTPTIRVNEQLKHLQIIKMSREEQEKEWHKQEMECTRKIAAPTDNHKLHYVDENIPIDTPFYDRVGKNPLLDSRHAFLSLCTTNRYQFDQLRRAKHSTMMVLYHLHNPEAPAHLYTCGSCNNDILSGKRYHCDICNGGDFDLCHSCVAKGVHSDQTHNLTPIEISRGVDVETNEQRRMKRVQDMRRARQRSLQLFLQALVHSSSCRDAECNKAACKKMRELLQHRVRCTTRVRGGCEICRRVLCLVQMHVKTCTSKVSCPVPHCDDLKRHMMEQQRQRQMGNGQMQQQQLQAQQQQAMNARGMASARGRRVVGRGGMAARSGSSLKATVVAGSGTKIKIKTSGTGIPHQGVAATDADPTLVKKPKLEN